MKHLFAILVVLIPACRFSLACGPFDRLCTPDQYYTFRLCGADMTGNDLRDSRTGRENSQMDNCRSWAKLTSTDIPLETSKMSYIIGNMINWKNCMPMP